MTRNAFDSSSIANFYECTNGVEESLAFGKINGKPCILRSARSFLKDFSKGVAQPAWRRAMSRSLVRLWGAWARGGTGGRALRVLGALAACATLALLFYNRHLVCSDRAKPLMYSTEDRHIIGADRRVYPYGRQMPLIFIGGVPRSGTTLMRAMLDAHPEVRCGQETRVIPRILQMRNHWLKSHKEALRLKEAGISKEVMDSAIASFCLEVIAKHGDPAPRLCNKDPLMLKMGAYVLELFPNSKFLFMVRDGRATVHSIISRKVTITGFDLTSYRQCMTKWNQAIETMYDQCKEIGPERCMMVYYEQLVLHPKQQMQKILQFLDVPWNESVLHHEEFINKPNGVLLSKVERSSDQVIKPVNLEALTKWVGEFPVDVVREMAQIAPMLSLLGYDPNANPPPYGAADAAVRENTLLLQRQQEQWRQKAQRLLRRDDSQSNNAPDYEQAKRPPDPPDPDDNNDAR